MAGDDQLPLRVSTLEIFFDLVFAFTLTQLTSVLASQVSWLAVGQVLLVFGLLWWMYGAYAWLTNARPPVHATERRAHSAVDRRARASRGRAGQSGWGRIGT